jgi:enterochelin esterase family protein
MKLQTLPAVLVAALLLSGVAAGQQTQGAPALTPHTLRDALAAKPEGPDAERLAERILRDFGGRDALLRGAAAKIDELTVAFAIEATELPANAPAPRVVADVGMFTMPLTKVGTSGVYAGVASLTHGAALTWHYEAGGRRVGGGQLDVYETHPDGKDRPGVPKGVTTQMPPWESKIFPGTKRDWWVYVPAQYRQDAPAAVMIFQDGAAVRDYVPIVFDNLIARSDMPVTVAIFIEPGGVQAPRDNRSFEYDTLSDQYARFLLEEMLPEVEKSVRLRHDAASRAISGASSGTICAFTVAWERPDEFSKVVSWIGSYTNIAAGKTLREGGHNYAALVRRVPRKPIRIFMQDGTNDLDNTAGSWTLANMTLARSLAFAGYDYRFEQGQGFHNNRHGRAILPDTLRWLWRDYTSPPTGTASR